MTTHRVPCSSMASASMRVGAERFEAADLVVDGGVSMSKYEPVARSIGSRG